MRNVTHSSIKREVAVANGIVWTDLIAFERDLLEAVHTIERDNETPYGLEIRRVLEDRYDGYINYSRLYPNLDRLVEKGLVEKSKLDKRTNLYQLTDDGEVLLEAHAKKLANTCGMEVSVTDSEETA